MKICTRLGLDVVSFSGSMTLGVEVSSLKGNFCKGFLSLLNIKGPGMPEKQRKKFYNKISNKVTRIKDI